jgi:hypothetical protein
MQSRQSLEALFSSILSLCDDMCRRVNMYRPNTSLFTRCARPLRFNNRSVLTASTLAAPACAIRQCSSSPPSPPSSSDHLQRVDSSRKDVSQSKYKVGDIDPELRAPRRATGLFSVKDTEDAAKATVGFSRIDDLESAHTEMVRQQGSESNALLAVTDEERWRHKLMFNHKVIKTPKHLTWAEFGKEVECLDCVIEMDDHRPEEIFSLAFQFRDRRQGSRDSLWVARNDVAKSSALPDLLAAIGSCLGRADVHRTIRFDDGLGAHRELTIKKNSRYTSEIQLAFRPPVEYDLYATVDENAKWETELAEGNVAGWGFHPGLADPEYRDLDDPVGTYHLTMSAHAFSIIILKAIDRLIQRPMTDFYRPSNIAKVVRARTNEEIGVSHAIAGWLGTDEKRFLHYTPMEAIEDHWFGADQPFTLTAIVNKIREMTYLKPENPEFRSWLAVRRHDSATAARNVRAKLLGAGASPLFAPLSHNATVSQLLPKQQRRNLQTTVSIAGMVGMPDETRRLAELKHIAETGKMLGASSIPQQNDSSSSTPLVGNTSKDTSPNSEQK